MDEYIKKSDLKAELLRRDFYPAIVKSALETIPPADVVPRAEVKMLQSQVNRLKKYDEERDIALHARLIANTRQEVAREIIAEILTTNTPDIDGFFTMHITELADLKKKYTEESAE